MNWTVYCMGDLPIFRDVINAVAMVFSSSLFDPTLGAGLVEVAMLISLFLFAMPVLMGKPLSPFPLMFVFLLYFGGIVPKVTLQIEDMYTGAGTTVANVPIIVAAPAAISASIAKGITDVVETAFSSPTQGTFLSLGAEGFVNPLKMLLALRNVGSDGNLTYFNTDLSQYVRDCAVNSPNWAQADLNTASDAFGYLMLLPVTGLTIYYSATNTQGYLVSCNQAQTNLVVDLNTLLTAPSTPTNPSALTKIINSHATPLNNSAGGAVAYEAAVNNVTSQILGNAQTSQQFMTNMLANSAITGGVRCAHASNADQLAECHSETMIKAGIEEGVVDAAGNASIFARTAVPMMNILLALFYAFSPIILGVALMSAAHGVKIIVGFLMFGAWTQSWMPIAAVMNFMVQEQVQNELNKFGMQGITLDNQNAFYTAISMKVGLASEMLAMTPMISMALLSGSMMALSSVAGKFSQDRIDETHAAPGLGKTGGLADQGALVSGNESMKVQNVDGSMAGGGAKAMSNGAVKTSEEIAIKNDGNTSVAQQVADKDELTRQTASNKNASLKKGLMRTDGSADSQIYNAAVETGFSQNQKNADNIVESDAEMHSMNAQSKTALKASLSAGFNLLGSGFKAEASKSFEEAQGILKSHGIKKDLSASIEQSKTTAEKLGHQYAVQDNSANQTALSKEFAETDQQTDAESRARSASITRATQESNAVGSTQTNGSNVLGALVANNYAGKGGVDAWKKMATEHMDPKKKDAMDAWQARADNITAQAFYKGDTSKLTQAQRADSMIQAMNHTDKDSMLHGLVGAGAVAVDEGMLHDKNIESAHQKMEPGAVPTQEIGENVGNAAKAVANVLPQTKDAKDIRGGKGVKHVPKLDGNGKPMMDKHNKPIYESKTQTVLRAFGMDQNLNGEMGAHPELTHNQQATADSQNAAFQEAQNHSGLAKVAGMALEEYDKFENAHPYIAAALSAVPLERGLSAANGIRKAMPLIETGIKESKLAISGIEKFSEGSRSVEQVKELHALKETQKLMEAKQLKYAKDLENANGNIVAGTALGAAGITAEGTRK